MLNLRAVIISGLLLMSLPASIHGQFRDPNPQFAPSGSCQFTWIGYKSLPAALIAMGETSCNGAPPVLIDTQDPLVPYVVFSYIWADFWAAPAHFVWSRPSSAPAASLALADACSRLAPYRRCGIVGSAQTPYAGGTWIVWNTTP